MKSLRESFSMWATPKAPGPALEQLPKSAAGLLCHKKEQQLAKLWSDMIRCEEGCRHTLAAARRYSHAAGAVQQEEERLVVKLHHIEALLSSPQLHSALGALDSLLPQVRDSVPEACVRLDSEVCQSVREYHALYHTIDGLRVKRDLMVVELNKIQDRLEKLRLKGKRSTDVLVEKERSQRQLEEIQNQLLRDVAAFHNLRAAYLLHGLHCYTDTQFLQYGGQAEQYKRHVVAGPAYRPNLASVTEDTAQHLARLSALNITDS